jgi:succinate--hydroxymethylglutarate CoA-transferase
MRLAAWGPPFRGGESAYFLSLNRNKKSVTIDLKHAEGRRLVRELAATADVFVENMLPGKMDTLGLGFADLSAVNPRLVYASVSGFGATGPYASRPGYDILAAAIGGLMSITGEEGGPPVKVGVAVTDVQTGLLTHGAILAALLARERTGRGQRVETSLLETQIAGLANVGSSYLVGGVEGRRRGTAHESIVPYQAFATADGHVVVAVGNNGQFATLCRLLGVPELAQDARFKTNPDRVRNRAALVARLSEIFAQRRTAEWTEVVPWSAVPFGPINSVSQAFSDPQVLHRRMVEEVEHPSAGRIRLAGLPAKFSEPGCGVRLPPPRLGEHTRQVLATLPGFSEERAQRLLAARVITDLEPSRVA